MRSLRRTSAESQRFRRALLAWHRRHGRTFSWRRTRDPYKVLIAELFLQKTQAKQVEPVYRRFLKEFPVIEVLARAPLRKIRRSVWSLGLVGRARNLKEMARIAVSRFGGKLPAAEGGLMELKGVGRYAANAVLCFALGQRRAVVDANVVRMLGRYFGIRSEKNRPHTDDRLWEIAQVLIPKKGAREYNWAVFDFAALVCTARKPECPECVLRRWCRWPEKTEGGS